MTSWLRPKKFQRRVTRHERQWRLDKTRNSQLSLDPLYKRETIGMRAFVQLKKQLFSSSAAQKKPMIKAAGDLSKSFVTSQPHHNDSRHHVPRLAVPTPDRALLVPATDSRPLDSPKPVPPASSPANATILHRTSIIISGFVLPLTLAPTFSRVHALFQAATTIHRSRLSPRHA